MAKKNLSDITTDIETVFNQVDPGSISPQEVEDLIKTIKDSFVNRVDHINLLGLRRHDENRAEPYVANEMTHKNGALHINRSGSQGSLDSTTFLQVTPNSILYDIRVINGTESFDQFELVQFENRAFQKLNNNSAWDVYDEFEFEEVSIPLPYFGQDYIPNAIYKAGMVTKATIDGREVYLRNTSIDPMLSNDIKTEWGNGDWAFVAQATGNGVTLLGATKTLDTSDHGKTFFVQGTNSIITIPFALPDSFKCDFLSVDSAYIDFEISGGGSIVSNSTGDQRVAPYGKVCLELYGVGFRKLTGDLTTSE